MALTEKDYGWLGALSRGLSVCLLMLFSTPVLATDPAWVLQTPASTVDTMYFVGQASRANTEDEARRLAIRNAMAEIGNFIGVKVNSEFRSFEREHNGKSSYDVQFTIHTKGRNLVLKGVRVERTYVVHRKNGTWACDVLISYPRAEYRELIKRIGRNDAETTDMALAMYHQGRKLHSKGNLAAASTKLYQALGLLNGLMSSVAVKDPSIKNTDILKKTVESELASVHRAARIKNRTVAVVVRLLINHSHKDSTNDSRTIRAEVSPVFTREGWTLASGALPNGLIDAVASGNPTAVVKAGRMLGAAYLVVLDLNAAETAVIYGEHFARASGTLTLADTGQAMVLYSQALKRVKGGHINTIDACRAALKKLKPAIHQAVENAVRRIDNLRDRDRIR